MFHLLNLIYKFLFMFGWFRYKWENASEREQFIINLNLIWDNIA